MYNNWRSKLEELIKAMRAGELDFSNYFQFKIEIDHLMKRRGERVNEREVQRFEKEKTSETLAEEMAIYIKEKSEKVLLDKRKFNELITKFWVEKYGLVLSHNLILLEEEINSKITKAEGLALNKYLELLTKDLTEWASNRNIMRLTTADVRLFLASKNIKLSTSFEQMLYREAKSKYRYLPPWMRE